MSESDATYQEIDLDNLPANPQLQGPADEFEIVEEGAVPEPAVPVKPVPQATPATSEADDEGEESTEAQAGDRKRLTRSQRLKSQRDLYAQQLSAAQQEIEALRSKASRFEADSAEAASIGMDFYIQTIDSNIKALRSEFDAAYDAGDRAKIFEVQQRMAELTADKKNAEREKRSIPRLAGPTNKQPGSATPPTAAPNQTAQPPQPRREAVEWASRNQDWFNKDRVMTGAAYTIDQTLVQEGYSPSDPDYFEELDKRIRNEFPHKFRSGTAAPPPRPSASPTVQNRASTAPVGGKVRVVITPEDRRFAEQLGLDIQTYAREKVKRDRSLQTATQYTEII